MIDARGMSCPIPVVMTQKEIKATNPKSLEILVDNMCSVENISRFASNQGYKVSYIEENEDYKITLTK